MHEQGEPGTYFRLAFFEGTLPLRGYFSHSSIFS